MWMDWCWSSMNLFFCGLSLIWTAWQDSWSAWQDSWSFCLRRMSWKEVKRGYDYMASSCGSLELVVQSVFCRWCTTFDEVDWCSHWKTWLVVSDIAYRCAAWAWFCSLRYGRTACDWCIEWFCSWVGCVSSIWEEHTSLSMQLLVPHKMASLMSTQQPQSMSETARTGQLEWNGQSHKNHQS